MWFSRRFKGRSGFLVQVACATLMSFFQAAQLLKSSQGQSITAFGIGWIYAALHVAIIHRAIRFGSEAGRAAPPAVWDNLLIYQMWMLYDVILIAAALGGGYKWSSNDTATLVLFFVGALLVAAAALGIARLKCGSWRQVHPWSALMHSAPQGIFAALCNAVPQFMIAVKILTEGGAAIPLVAIITANTGMIIRLFQIAGNGRRAGWNSHWRWLFFSEVANEFSYAAATAAWIYWRLTS